MAEDGEVLDGLVVVSNEIHHPMPILPQLLCIHRLHLASLPVNWKTQKDVEAERKHQSLMHRRLGRWKKGYTPLR